MTEQSAGDLGLAMRLAYVCELLDDALVQSRLNGSDLSRDLEQLANDARYLFRRVRSSSDVKAESNHEEAEAEPEPKSSRKKGPY